MSKPIFTFGSNTRGAHGKGAALYALKHHGAVYGQGVGLQGNSYAIPTKDANLRPLPLADIARYVDEFKRFAKANPAMSFFVTAVGTGLAGYLPSQIGPMFADAPINCFLPESFEKFCHANRDETAGDDQPGD